MHNLKKKIKNYKYLLKHLLIIVITVIVITLLYVLLITIPFKGKVFSNIFVAGIYLGDTKKEEAVTKLTKEIDIPDKILLQANNQKYEILSSEVMLKYDFEKSTERAYLFSNTGNFFENILNRTKLIFKPKNFTLFIKHDDQKLNEALSIVYSKLGSPPVLPVVTYTNNQITVDKGKNGVEVDTVKTTELLKLNLAENKTEPTEIFFKNLEVELSQEEEKNIYLRAQKLISKNIVFDHEDQTINLPKNDLLSFLNYQNTYDNYQIQNYIFKLAEKINRPFQNSVFLVNNGKVEVFIPSKDGIVVDEKELENQLKIILTRIETETEEENEYVIKIPVTVISAKIKNEDVNNLGIKTLLGKGVSYFRGSIPNRVYNINHASSKFKGILVAPGETFSFNSVLGDVSALTGYKSAYVIKEGKTVLGDGGGVCQVSTTLFRAVLKSGLPVVERRAHSYRVGYYEQGSFVGLDATIYHPTTDLKFTNNTPAHILIQSEIDIPNSTLIFEIYGTSDNRIATTTKPIITSSIAPPEDLYIDEPTLPAGKIQQIEHKAWGAKVKFDYLVKRGEEILTKDTFYSNYRPWQAVFLKGTGQTQ